MVVFSQYLYGALKKDSSTQVECRGGGCSSLLLTRDNPWKSLGAELVLIKTHCTVGALLDSIETIVVTTVTFNHLHVPVSLVRDHNIKEKLVEIGIFVQSYNGDLLYEPWEIYDERGYAFTTFEAYRDKCSHMQMEPVSHLPPWRLVPAAGTIVMCSVEELGLEDEAENLHLIGHAKSRAKSWVLLLTSVPVSSFWRAECEESFRCLQMKQLLWSKEENSVGKERVHFKAWRQGWTGYPLVEAGMRELWATDLESDILGWQYISGSLPDAHELERLDNPEIQGSKFEPEGEYVRCWLPELTRMPTEWIHHAGDAPMI
ncbi:hypothetical protein NC651_020977 [Populus alba x Populus x berolinensis]|nr:hypothetical protein NC651_020977 [Populus alba x Populus x berolinensis]